MTAPPAVALEFRFRWFVLGFFAAFVIAYILTGDPSAFSEPVRAILKKYIVPDEASSAHVFKFTSLVVLLLSGWAGVTCTNPHPKVTRYTNKTIKGFLLFSGTLLGHFFGYSAWHLLHTEVSLRAIGLLSFISLIVLEPIWIASSLFSVVELIGSNGLKPWQQRRIPYFRAICFVICVVAIGTGIAEYIF